MYEGRLFPLLSSFRRLRNAFQHGGSVCVGRGHGHAGVTFAVVDFEITETSLDDPSPKALVKRVERVLYSANRS
jgi:hypothetical protein